MTPQGTLAQAGALPDAGALLQRLVNLEAQASPYKVLVALTPAAVAANTTAEQIFAVPGVAPNDVVSVSKPTAQAGLGIVGARVSSAGNVGITFSNNTAAGITPTAAETYLIAGVR